MICYTTFGDKRYRVLYYFEFYNNYIFNKEIASKFASYYLYIG